ADGSPASTRRDAAGRAPRPEERARLLRLPVVVLQPAEEFDRQTESRLGDGGGLEVELVQPVRPEGAEVAPVALHARAVARARRARCAEHGLSGLPGELVRRHQLSVDPVRALLAERRALLHRRPRVLVVELAAALEDRARGVRVGEAEAE